MLHPGLYEQVINNTLNSELSEVPEVRKSTAPIDAAEASKVLAQYLTDVVQKGLENVQDNGGGIEAQIQLANEIVSTIQTTTHEPNFALLGVDQRAEQLLALLRDNDPRLAAGKTLLQTAPWPTLPTAVCGASGGNSKAKHVHLPGGAERCQLRESVCR